MKFNIWTVLFQAVNFVILLVILKRILYKPVREVMEKRREAVEKRMSDAERTKSEAEELKNRCQEEMNRLKEQRAQTLEALQDEVSRERERLISKARDDADNIIAREKALLSREKQTVETELKENVLDSVSVYSSSLLRDIADETLHEAVVRKFLAGLERTILEITAEAGGSRRLPVELSTAYPLHDGDVEKIRDAVRSRIGRDVTVAVTIEPELIAGVRMKAGDRVIDSSLAGQVRALRERLKQSL